MQTQPNPHAQAYTPGCSAQDSSRTAWGTRTPQIMLASLLLGVLLLAGGCGSKFAGEWVEDGSYTHDGVFTPTSAERRMALKFEPPATVRYGFFKANTGVVDVDSIQNTDYQTLNHREVAEFGEMVARVAGDHLLVDGPRDVTLRMSRLKGQQIFPANVLAPQLTRADLKDGAGSQLAPVLAVKTVSATPVLLDAMPGGAGVDEPAHHRNAE